MVKKQVVTTPGSSSSSSSSSSKVEATTSTALKYKGVRKRKWGKWVSEIRLPNSRERIWLGSYDSAEKAARAFDAAQFCLRGKSANFNFPDNPPEIAGGRSMTPAEIQVAAARFANLYADHVVPQQDTFTDTTTETDTETTSYSPSVSDGVTNMGQVESGSNTDGVTNMGQVGSGSNSEVVGIESSFSEQLRLNSTLGSGNYVSEFGYFSTGYDEFTPGDYYCPPPENFECGGEDHYDATIYQDSYLWNF